jgi:ribosomal protein S6--L-glutamate ligase
MHIGIVTGVPGWHVQDLLRAGRKFGHECRLIDATKLVSTIGVAQHDDLQADALLIRAFPSGTLEQTLFRLAALYRAEREGRLVLNPPAAFEACVDKFTATSRLAAAGLPVLPTICCQTLDEAMLAFDQLDGDVVVKPLFGSEGKGVQRVTDRDLAWRTCSTLCQLGAVLYLQRFIPHPGYDLRVFVLGGQVLAGMRRRATDWRTNIARGGTPEAVRLSDHEIDLALRAAKAVGAEMAGVDLIPGPGDALSVLEVNGVPGWRALAQVTGLDVATTILRFVEQRVQQRGA